MSQGFTSPIGPTGVFGLGVTGPTLPNVKFINGFVGNAGTGDIDLYTVPTGRRAIIIGLFFYNGGISSLTIKAEIKISGAYYIISPSVSASASSVNTISPTAYVAEAGQSFAVNTSASGGNLWLKVLEFDSTAPLRTVNLTSLANGDNTLYTAPASKSAYVSPTGFFSQVGSSGYVGVYNGSGGTRSYIVYVVPSGGTSGSTNRAIPATNVSDGAIGRFNSAVILNTGDFIVLNTNAATATQFAWVTVAEV